MPQKKLAIVTRADSEINEMTKITHPIMRDYAKKVGADFIILDDPKGLHIHYRILQFYDLFEKYDRLISLDSDILISPDCPNLFDKVDYKKIGSVFEDIGNRTAERRERIKKAQLQFGDIGWKSGYINTGVAVFSKCHREIFKERELYLDLGYDDVYLGYWIHKLGFEIQELDWKWNFMKVFGDQYGHNTRYEAYIIHYAGQGGFMRGKSRLDILKHDHNVWYSEFPQPEMKFKAILDAFPKEWESVADIGCEQGTLTNYLKKQFPEKKVLAIDVVDKNRYNLDVILWDIQEDPPEGLEADVVVASEVLEHIRWWKDALKNLLKITKKKLILTFPYGNSYLDPDHRNFWDDYSIEEIKELVAPYKITINKTITKPDDVKNNWLIYLVEITK